MAQELNRFRELDVGQEIEVSAPVVEEAAPVVQKAILGRIKSPQTAEALKQFMGSDATSEPAKHYREQLKKALGSDFKPLPPTPESELLNKLIRKNQEEAMNDMFSRVWDYASKPLSKHQVFESYQPYCGSWDNPEPPF